MRNTLLHGKRGMIMLAFLVKLFITLTIFLGTASMIGKVSSVLMDQSGDNFVEFASELQSVYDQGSGTRLSTLLILDDGTAVVYFEGNEAAILELYYFERMPSVTFSFSKPKGCSDDSVGCLCLMQSLSSDDTQQHYEVLSNKARCVEMDFPLELTDCSISSKARVFEAVSYRCHNGFVIDRNVPAAVMSKSRLDDAAHLYTERRQDFLLENKGGTVQIVPGTIYTYVPDEVEHLSADVVDHVGG